jgi:hypothetical protein
MIAISSPINDRLRLKLLNLSLREDTAIQKSNKRLFEICRALWHCLVSRAYKGCSIDPTDLCGQYYVALTDSSLCIDAVLKRKLIVEERGIYEGSGRRKTSY